MGRTNWDDMATGKELSSIKRARKSIVVSKKISSNDLLEYVDAGWEKSKDYKNSKYVGVSKIKPIKQQLEDKLWVLFHDMGFKELNRDSEIFISYDFHEDSLKKETSVLAVDDETVLATFCFVAESERQCDFLDEIKNKKDTIIKGMRKEIQKEYPGRKIKFLLATYNYLLTRFDITMIEKEDLFFFDNNMIEYYSELVKHLGSCSRYQLLGHLFESQEIKNMDDRVPAIQGKMGGHTYYSFSIEPEKLLKIGYVLHRSIVNNMTPSYQRIIKKKRLHEVREFISSGGYFPNSIIISIDTRGRGLSFDQAAMKIDGTISKIGVLHIPKYYRSAYIIDGQHRLYGYSNSMYAETNTVPVVAFVDLDRNEQIKLFMDINENQKAVPKSLRVTLNADMLWDSSDLGEQRQALRSRIAQMLGEETTSPLYSRIVIGENDVTNERCITVEAVQSALKKCDFLNEYDKRSKLIKEGTFDCNDNQETCNILYPFIEKCLVYLRQECKKEWEQGDRENGMLTINRGIQAVIRVINDIVNMLIKKEMISPKTQELEDMFVLIVYYLKPLSDYINNLNYETRKNLRGFFGGGADTRFWRAYQKSIADVRLDFQPEGLETFIENESKQYNDETKELISGIQSKLKSIISERLEELYGDAWLIKGLPQSIYIRAKSEADKVIYNQTSETGEEIEIPIWDFVSLLECRDIVLHAKNWSSLFEDTLVRPEDEKKVGGKEAKTEWIQKISAINNKLLKDSYSVPVDDYNLVKSVHDWIIGFLVF